MTTSSLRFTNVQTRSFALLWALGLGAAGCGGRLDLGHEEVALRDDAGEDGGTDGGTSPTTLPGYVLSTARGTVAIDRFGDQACGVLGSGDISCWGAAANISGTFTSVTDYGAQCGVLTSGAIVCETGVEASAPAGTDYVRVTTDEAGNRICGLTSAGAVVCNASNGAPAQSLAGPFFDVATNNDAVCELATGGAQCQGFNGETVLVPSGSLKAFQLIESTADGSTDLVGNSCGLRTDGTPVCTSSSLPTALKYDEASFQAAGDSTPPSYCGIAGGALTCFSFTGEPLAVPAGTFEHVTVTMSLGNSSPFACATDIAGKVTCFLLDGTAAQPPIGSPSATLVFKF